VNIGEYLAISNGAESGIASFAISTSLHGYRPILARQARAAALRAAARFLTGIRKQRLHEEN
jgi:hypothetical protein